jgi:hypothetical protein
MNKIIPVIFIGIIATLVPTLAVSEIGIGIAKTDCTPGANSTCPAGQSEGKASTSTSSCTYVGCNGDVTCQNPNGGLPDCPVHHHTTAYWTGFKQGVLDKQHNSPETPIDMCNSADLAGKDALHCVAGYNDGLNGIRP